jgi:uncharacterized protein YutE (UPF0331/DUF86 family)
MVKNGVILSKLSTIEEYITKLNGYLPASFEEFKDDWGLQKIAERSLQVMIEIMIDIAERIIAQKDVLPPETSAEAMKKLQEIGAIKNHESYVKMIRFRNLVVHNYDSIDIEILYSIITKDINDIKMFMDEIRIYEGI